MAEEATQPQSTNDSRISSGRHPGERILQRPIGTIGPAQSLFKPGRSLWSEAKPQWNTPVEFLIFNLDLSRSDIFCMKGFAP